jgi:hypothetical protein
MRPKYGPNLFRPANVSEYFRPISELPPGQECVLACRVSSAAQERAGNLRDQEARRRREVGRRDGVVVHVHAHVGWGADPGWLSEAVQEALEHPGSALVVEDVTRTIRPTIYYDGHPDAPLKEWDLRLLRHLARGVPLYTLTDPDAAPGEIRSRQPRRGQQAKGRRGGRPLKGRDRFRRKWLPRVLELREEGVGYRPIATTVSEESGKRVTHMTVRKWIKSYSGEGKLSPRASAP